MVIPPVDQTVSVGGTAAFSLGVGYPGATASVTNLVRFQWQLNGTNVAGATNATLTLPNVQQAQDGLYSAVVTLTNNLPAPATFSAILTVLGPDFDSDGIPDDYEIAHGLNYQVNDAGDDPDHDTMTNWQEFQAGTDPTNSLSYLKIEIQGARNNLLRVSAVARRSYTILYSSTPTGPWSRLIDINSSITNRIVEIPDTFATPTRYYRLRTPKQP